MAYASAMQGGYGAGASVIHADASHFDSVSVPDAELLFTGDFKRAGPDLVLTGHDGRHHIIPGYFSSEKHPALVAPNGASLSPDLVDLLAGSPTPGEYAQAQPTTPPDAIGKVEKVVGSAAVMRNGVAVALHVGDAVYKSDVVQTGADSSVGIGFPDGTALNLVANTRMALNDYVYDPNGTSNDALFSLVQGTFSFVAGKVAHTGDMKIETPVATMGIRGTTGYVQEVATITATLGNVAYSFAVVADYNSTGNGQYDLIDANGNIIATVSQTGTVTYVTPQGPGAQPLVTVQAATAAQMAFEQAIIQQVFQTLNQINNPNPNPNPNPSSPGSSTPPNELQNFPQLLQQNGGTPFAVNIPVPAPSGATNVSATVTITTNTPPPTTSGQTSSTPSSTPTTIDWNSQSSGTWETGSDWLGGNVPAATGSVEINLPVTVTIDESETIASLVIGPSSTLDIVVGGTLVIANGISNAGVIEINSSGADPTLKIDGTVYLLDGGEIEMLGSAASNLIIGVPGTGATLVNVDNTIIGTGTIGQGDGNLTLVNGADGLIEAKPLLPTDTGILVIDTGNVVNNSGGLEAVAGGTLQIDDGVNNLGTILADGGTVNIDNVNTGVGNSGLIEAVDGGTVSITGSVTNVSGATIEAVDSGSTVSLTGYVSNASGGTMEAVDGGTLNLNINDGDSNNYGTVKADGGTININATDLTVNTNGDGGNFGTSEAVDGGTLTITGGIPNSGMIEAIGLGATVNLEGGGPANTGTLEARDGGTLVLSNITVSNAGGTIEAIGSDAAVNLEGATITGGTLATSGGGIIETPTGTSTFVGVTIADGSFIETNDGTSIDLQGTTTLGGTVTLEGGGTFTLAGTGAEITRAAGANATLDNLGTISGAGTIGTGGMALVNDGVIDANDVDATLTLDPTSLTNDGTLEAINNATLAVDVNITGSGSAMVSGDGTLVLGGTDAQEVMYSGAGTFAIEHFLSGDFTGLIGNFNVGDAIDLADLTDTSGVHAVWTQTSIVDGGNGTLGIFNGTTLLETLDLSGVYDQTNFLVTSDPSGKAEVVYTTATEDSWVNTLGGAWTTGSNWTGGVPTSATTAVIDIGGTYTVTISGDVAANTLTIGNANATLSGSGTLSIATTIDNDGTIEATTGTLTVDPSSIDNSGLLEATGGGTLVLSDTTVTNTGGMIEAIGANALVNLFDSTIAGGTLFTSGPGSSGSNIDVVVATGANMSVFDGTTEGALTIAGYVGVFQGAQLELQGTIHIDGANGEIDVGGPTNGPTTQPTNLVIDGLVKIDTDGLNTTSAQISLDGDASNTVQIIAATGGGTLDNVNTMIAGAGQIGDGNPSFILINEQAGIINAVGTTALVIDNDSPATNNYAANAIVNSGYIEANGSGGLAIKDSTIVNSTYNPSDNSGVDGHIVANSLIDLDNATILQGFVSISPNGEIDTVSGSSNEIETANGSTHNTNVATIINAGTIAVNDDSSLTLASPDAIDNSGTIQLSSTGDATYLYFDQGFAGINGSGEITLSDSTENFIAVTQSGDQLTNFDNTISGAGTIGGGGMVLVNQTSGVIDADDTNPLVLATGANAIINAGLMEASDGSTLELDNVTVNNTGTIAVNAENLEGGSPTYLEIAGTVTLQGGDGSSTGLGLVTLTDDSDNAIVSNGSAAELINADNTISGAGTIGDAHLTLDNETYGVIDADGSNPLVLATGANAIINAGLMEATGGGTLEILSDVDNVGGTIAAHDGVSSVQLSDVTITGGTLTTDSVTSDSGGVIEVVVAGGLDTSAFDGSVDAVTVAGFVQVDEGANLELTGIIDNQGTIAAQGDGAQVQLSNATIEGGTFSTANDLSDSGGVIEVLAMPDSANMSVLDGSTNAVTIEGYVQVDSGANLELIGTIHNQGTLDVDTEGPSTTDLIIEGAVTLDGGGTVTLDRSGDDIIGASSGGTLYNDDGTISGAGQIGNSGNFDATSLTLFNESSGVIDATGGTLTLDTGNTISNHGLLEATNYGTLDVQDSAIYNTGTGANGILIDGTSELLVDTATLQLSGGGDVSLSGGQIISNGDIEVHANSGSIIYVPEQLDNVDNTISGDGTIGSGSDSPDLMLTNEAAGTINANISGDTLTLYTGNMIDNAGTLEATSGGILQIDDSVCNSGGTVDANGGTVDIAGAISGGSAIIEGGGMLEYGGCSNVATSFDGSGTLVLAGTDSTPHFTGTLSDFSTGDVIDLTGIQYASDTEGSGTILSYDSDDHTLTVTDQGGHSIDIHLSGHYTQDAFAVTSDTSGKAEVVFNLGAGLSGEIINPFSYPNNSVHDADTQTPDATFVATDINYNLVPNTGGSETGNTKVGEFLDYNGQTDGHTVSNPNVADASVANTYFKMDGYIALTGGVIYTFLLNSDDGSTLSIDGTTLIDDDGIHANTNSLYATFTPSSTGFYPIEIRYFENSYGGANLLAQYEAGDSGNFVDLTSAVLSQPLTPVTIDTGLTLHVSAPAADDVTFAGRTGTLVLDQPATFVGQIVGFTGTAANANSSDVIDLAGINYNSGDFSDTYNTTTGVLTVTDGTNTASLTFVDFTGTFKFASDGQGGTDIFDPPTTGTNGHHAGLTPATSVSLGGPGNDNFLFHPSLGADTGNANSPDDAAELERFTSAQAQHWSPLISNAAHDDAIDFVHHSDGITPSDLNAAHWHLALQSAVHLH